MEPDLDAVEIRMRPFKRIIIGAGLGVAGCFYLLICANDGEPFFGPPHVVDGFLLIGFPCLGLFLWIVCVCKTIFRAVRYRFFWPLLWILPLAVLGTTFCTDSLEEYLGDIRAAYFSHRNPEHPNARTKT